MEKGKFYKLPRKAWEIISLLLITVAVTAVICIVVFFFVYVPKDAKLAVGITGIVSAFLLFLCTIYGYNSKVKKYWDSERMKVLMQDPEYVKYLEQYREFEIKRSIDAIKDDDTLSDD